MMMTRDSCLTSQQPVGYVQQKTNTCWGRLIRRITFCQEQESNS